MNLDTTSTLEKIQLCFYEFCWRYLPLKFLLGGIYDAGANDPINENNVLDHALIYSNQFDLSNGVLISLHKGQINWKGPNKKLSSQDRPIINPKLIVKVMELIGIQIRLSVVHLEQSK